MPVKNMQESALLPVARCEEIFGDAVAAGRASGVRDLEAMMGAGTYALTMNPDVPGGVLALANRLWERRGKAAKATLEAGAPHAP